MIIFNLIVKCISIFFYYSIQIVRGTTFLETIVDKESTIIAKGVYQGNVYVFKILKKGFVASYPDDAYLQIGISQLLMHPNIISLKNTIYEVSGNIILFYEEGERTLQFCAFSNLKEIKKAIRDILVGLLYMHGKGVIHNDIKPDNIVKVGEYYKIIDFGCARFFNPEMNYNFIFNKGNIYPQIAPEVRKNGKHNLKSDVFGVGFILGKILVRFLEQNNYISAEEKLKTEEFLRRLYALSPSERFSVEEALYDSWFTDIKIKFSDLTKYKDCKNKKLNFSKKGHKLNIRIDEKTKLKIITHKAADKSTYFFTSIYLNDTYVVQNQLPTYYIEIINIVLSDLKKI